MGPEPGGAPAPPPAESASTCDAAASDARRSEIAAADPRPRPHDGVLIVDDTGDRETGSRNAPVPRRYLGLLGKVENGSVHVTVLWADGRVS